ncbi:MAG: carboxylating nicotinate-nucleotide diphosphorylase [Rhodospirillales bacterium]|mgnify:CR=1 FL=1|jgi:nicotinate-nucleotide pyrophosphorylase (carboxylating)|nr:nicotinate-nucleotide diphosphorylase (carboxylating) [Rhodospirillaceae bacterium]MDP6426408.1 carboxylating nicotinate-nucleotide diphosphorylase [Rhodospirillales bacterium]MDP6645755.1 carboxylating nicotinate-nucleotide diphosphorylase [Rhodospirillales bacterium]MDP6840329.1 carboxylating nicotinate-nucleotide diphosphorylase [Rhodospirillales bacterium]|tara:strand:- start:736 stop:1605 length:870 start_codon:yes stop_codon:yes gene_type:complete
MPPDLPPKFPRGLDAAEVQKLIDTAIAEDIGKGDITSEAVIPPGTNFHGLMSARQDMVCAGLPVARAIFETFSGDIEFEALAADGDRVPAGGGLARISGPALALLGAERTAINMLQHLSGIATLTRKYVDQIEGTGAVLLDTRKTTPGLRQLQKYATRMGGATNHRMRLDDGVLIKDNHIVVAGGVAEAVSRARAKGLTDIEVECDTLKQVREALEAGADSILLDNMEPDKMTEAVAMVGGKIPTEASGNVKLETIREIAETGVTYASAGRITYSAPAIDIGLDWSAAD